MMGHQPPYQNKFFIAAIQNINVLIAQPKDRMSKSNVLPGEIANSVKTVCQGYSLKRVLIKVFGRLNLTDS